MIGILNHYGVQWAEYFGLAVMQNTLFLGLVFLVLYKLSKRAAQVKYMICLAGLLKLLLPPFLPAHLHSQSSAPLQPSQGYTQLFSFGAASTGTGAAAPAAQRLDLPGLLFAIWAGAVLLYILFTLISTVRLAFVLRNASQVPSDHLPPFVNGRRISVYKTGRIAMPITLVVFPRKIFVPAAWDRWTQECREMVLQHEMAHIRRLDGLFLVFQILAQALYFFHPFVLHLGRRLARYREMACDDASIGSGKSSSVEYSKYLVEIAETVVSNPVTCESASALIRRKNELLSRVNYQMKEGGRSIMSKRKLSIVLAGLILLILPFSWYYSEAKPERTRRQEQQEKKKDKQDPEKEEGSTDNKKAEKIKLATPITPQDRVILKVDDKEALPSDKKDVNVLVGKKIKINDKVTDLEDVKVKMKELLIKGKDEITVTLVCEDEVKMGTLHKLQEIFREFDIVKFKYKNDLGLGIPYNLPPLHLLERLEKMPEGSVATIHIDASGNVFLDEEEIDPSAISGLIEKRISDFEGLIVSIKSDKETEYKYFVNVLEQVRKANASRVLINVPE